MREFGTWLWLLGKRQLKRSVFLAVLLLVPLACGLLLRTADQEDAGVRVALVCEDPDAMTQAAVEELCRQTGVYRFYQCSREQAVRDVEAREAECAFVFPDELAQRMRKGEAENSIRTFSSPSSVAAQLSYEVVYAALFSHYAEEVFVDYVKGNPLFAEENPDILDQEARDAYRNNRENGRTFAFAFEQLEGNGTAAAVETNSSSGVAVSVRGLLAVFVFLGGLMGALDSLRDQQHRAYLAASPGLRHFVPVAAVAVPASLTALSAGAAILVAGLSVGGVREWLLLGLYWILVTGFGSLLPALLRRQTLLCAVIPILIMGSLLFSPVFLRLGSLSPVFRVLEKLFLPSYYLNSISDGTGQLVLAAVLVMGASLLLQMAGKGARA